MADGGQAELPGVKAETNDEKCGHDPSTACCKLRGTPVPSTPLRASGMRVLLQWLRVVGFGWIGLSRKSGG
jgi:hypothetical protein